MSTSAHPHTLVVTLADLTPEEQAEYDTVTDPAERRDWDHDRTEVTIECAGPSKVCEFFWECTHDHPHVTPDDPATVMHYCDAPDDCDGGCLIDEGEALFHGVWHEYHYGFGWCVTRVGVCGLNETHDQWIDSASEVASRLGPGRHPVDFDYLEDFIDIIEIPAIADPASKVTA